MKPFFVAALVGGLALAYGAAPHAVWALDYNGVRALVAQLIGSPQR